LSGAPGSGKSTFCARLPRTDWAVVNQDTIGNRGTPGTRKQCAAAVKKALFLRKNVVIDRCGLTVEQRATFIDLATRRDADAPAFATPHCLWFDLPRTVLFQRLAKRKGHPTVKDGAGVSVCKRMLGDSRNAPPSRNEGFSKITRCETEADVERAVRMYSADARFGGANQEVPPTPMMPPSRSGNVVQNVSNVSNVHNVHNVSNRARSDDAIRATSRETTCAMDARHTRRSTSGFSWSSALSELAAAPQTAWSRDVVLFHDEELVVAKDAYPKSETHLLVLARDARFAEGPSTLRARDAPLVRRMVEVGLRFAERQSGPLRGDPGASSPATETRFMTGFHAAPSMRALHLHVVSRDLRGSGMRTRRHWNSFTTGFFKDGLETAAALEALGTARLSADAEDEPSDLGLQWDLQEAERAAQMTALRCHKCLDGPFPNMPKLFAHVDACLAT